MIHLTESARALLAALSILVVGAVAGVTLDRTVLIPAHADAAAAGVRRGVPRHHDEVLAELRIELGLSAEQFAQLQETFARHHAESQAAWAQTHANHRRTMQTVTTEFETILDSAQIERLHAWLAKRHAGHAHG